MDILYKKCRFCGETIKDEAIKCRFCGERLSEKKECDFLPSGFRACPHCLKAIRQDVSLCPFCRNQINVATEEITEKNSATSAGASEPSASLWYIQTKYGHEGPYRPENILLRYQNGEIDSSTLLWQPGGEWTPLWRTSLAGMLKIPPPLSGDEVNNTALWFLAFFPIWGDLICRVITGFVQVSMVEETLSTLSPNDKTEIIKLSAFVGNEVSNVMQSALKYAIATMDTETFVSTIKAVGIVLSTNTNTFALTIVPHAFFLIVNALLCTWDSQIVARSGYSESRVNPWWCLLVPVYMYKRAKILKSGWACFWVWIISLLASAYLIDSLVSEFFGGFYL